MTSWSPCLVLSEKLEEQDHLCPAKVLREESSGPSFILTPCRHMRVVGLQENPVSG